LVVAAAGRAAVDQRLGDGELGDDRPLRDGQTGDAARHHSRRSRSHTVATVSIRYVVDDVDAAIAFYCRYLEDGTAPRSRSTT
jgi:hypothetical protein